MGEVDSFGESFSLPLLLSVTRRLILFCEIVHVFEYDGMPGFEQTKNAIRESKGHLTFFNKEILPLIQSRTNQVRESLFLPLV